MKSRFEKSEENPNTVSKASVPPKPGTLPTKPGTSPSKPRKVPEKPGIPPTNSRAISPKPATVPSKPGVPPTKPGSLPTKPGTLPTKPGTLPTKPETLPPNSKTVSKSSVLQKAANFSQDTKPTGPPKPTPGSKPWNQTISNDTGKNDVKPKRSSFIKEKDGNSQTGTLSHPGKQTTEKKIGKLWENKIQNDEKRGQDENSQTGNSSYPGKQTTEKKIGKLWENKIQNDEKSTKVPAIATNSIDIKSLTNKIAGQLGTTSLKVPQNDPDSTEATRQNKKTASSRDTMPDFPPPPPPVTEEDAEEWNSWVDGDLPPPLEDDISAPAANTLIQGRSNSSNKYKPLPVPPGQSSHQTNNLEETSSEEPVFYKDEPLPKTIQMASEMLALQPFKKGFSYPPSAPDRPAEMVIRRAEVLGSDFQGKSNQMTISFLDT